MGEEDGLAEAEGEGIRTGDPGDGKGYGEGHGVCRCPLREYVSAPGKVFPRFGVAPRDGVKDSHSSV